MITLIYGPNNYAARQALDKLLAAEATTEIERRDGEELSANGLRELVQGVSLFASSRVVIIKNASKNKPVWEALASMADTLSDSTHVILVEEAPDKRTKPFKTLQAIANVIVCDDLDESRAVQWLCDEAVRRGGKIEPKDARVLVEKVGTDQWRLHYALEKLLVAGDTSATTIHDLVEASPQANVFALLDAAFQGKKADMQRLLADCAAQEDPYKFFGLLAAQIFQLVAISAAEHRSVEQVAKDIGSHPYPLKKMQAIARKLSPAEVKQVVEAVAKLDDQLKSSAGEPWVLIETAMQRIAAR